MSISEKIYSNDCEKAVIACLLKDSSLVKDVLSFVDPSDFYLNINRSVFNILVEKYQVEPNATYSELVSMMSTDELKNLAFFCLRSFYDATINKDNAKAYASIVRERSILRSLIENDSTNLNDSFKIDLCNKSELKSEIMSLINKLNETLINPVKIW